MIGKIFRNRNLNIEFIPVTLYNEGTNFSVYRLASTGWTMKSSPSGAKPL